MHENSHANLFSLFNEMKSQFKEEQSHRLRWYRVIDSDLEIAFVTSSASARQNLSEIQTFVC
jgi:hypothetical protein